MQPPPPISGCLPGHRHLWSLPSDGRQKAMMPSGFWSPFGWWIPGLKSICSILELVFQKWNSSWPHCVQGMFIVVFCRCCCRQLWWGERNKDSSREVLCLRVCEATIFFSATLTGQSEQGRLGGVGPMSLFRSMSVLPTANNFFLASWTLSTGIWWPSVLVIPGQGGTKTLAPLSGIHAVNLQCTGCRNGLWVDQRDHCNAESHFPDLYCATASLRWSAIQYNKTGTLAWQILSFIIFHTYHILSLCWAALFAL